MRIIISYGKTATTFLTHHIGLHGFKALHGTDHALADTKLVMAQRNPDKIPKDLPLWRLYLNEVAALADDPAKLVSIHSYSLNSIPILTGVCEGTSIPMAFSHREPVTQALSLLVSKMNIADKPLELPATQAFADFLAQVEIPLTSAQKGFLLIYTTVITLMAFFGPRSTLRLRYEDLKDNTGKLEQQLSDFLETEFRFRSTDVINKQSGENYMERVNKWFGPQFVEWFDGAIFPESRQIHAAYGYESSMADVLAGRGP